MKKKILFVIGSPNQTTQMHLIAQQLSDFDCWFSQIYDNSWYVNFGIRMGWLNHTIVAGHFKAKADAYLAKHGLQSDYMGKQNQYDLVVMCTDLLIPSNILNTKNIWVQEGMIDKMTWWSKWIQKMKLPGWVGLNTSLNGSSNLLDVYCVASEGYKSYLTEMGTSANKLFVTGIPNYDNVRESIKYDFPHHDYVMVATTDFRETFRKENRPAFIEECIKIANGRRLLFKLHPNEQYERAVQEIRAIAPADTLIFQEGNTNEMIANCTELITQYSTVVYVGIALGKPVHSYFDLNTLYRQAPIQNGGTSAQNIAQLARDFIDFDGKKEDFVKEYQLTHGLMADW